MNLYTIEEFHNKETTIIGVSDSIERANGMISEYYEEYQLITKDDIRDSGIECIYHIECDGERCKVIIRDHTLNKI